jgi:hypothetical protein
MNNVPFYERCFKMKVVDQKEIRIACCGNSLLFVRRFGVKQNGSSVFGLRESYVEPVQIKM